MNGAALRMAFAVTLFKVKTMDSAWNRSARPLCRVWRGPRAQNNQSRAEFLEKTRDCELSVDNFG